MIRTSAQFELALTEALGINPDRVRGITLTVQAGQVPVVTIEQWTNEVVEDELVALLRHYKLVPIDEDGS